MVNIISGTTRKLGACGCLKAFFSNHEEYDGTLYIGYPFLDTESGICPVDALWISRAYGIVAFDLVDGTDISSFDERQDDLYNKLEARLRGCSKLVNKRKFMVEINVLTYAPLCSEPNLGQYPLCNDSNLGDAFRSYSWDHPEYYEPVLSELQAMTNIRKANSRRQIHGENTRGAKLEILEDAIATLDVKQGEAVIDTVEGVQRIRGLAGSGKTVVLALKAAYLHVAHPEWKIAITFVTRSLKDQFKQLINRFCFHHGRKEPDWDQIQIIHAWGSSASNGIYYNYCIENGSEFYAFQSAKYQFGAGKEFAGACQEAINTTKTWNEKYDMILIDEAQDMPSSFFKLCYRILRNPKRLVYAYDELQSLNAQSLPGPEELFGYNETGIPNVHFTYDEKTGTSRQDIILNTCYRNSRPILVAAHAIGFGIYRQCDPTRGTGLVQMFQRKELWKEIGYQVQYGDLREGCEVELGRTSQTSPKYLENHSSMEDILVCKVFSSKQEQDEWVVSEIIKNLKNDELQANDIIVINPQPYTTRQNVGEVRAALFENGIQSHITGVDDSSDFFKTDIESITFTGIHRAKENEAAMVYIINADECLKGENFGITPYTAINRNRLFTAITRSKAWVRIVGVGDDMSILQQEIERVRENNYALHFNYPTSDQINGLNIVNRDMSNDSRKNIMENRRAIDRIIEDAASGRLLKEDLSLEQIEGLKNLWGE